ncbi:carbamoyltransferase [Stappia taiwanensis]|uniref:Carbamoyltransferase n=1 Tax=Stappia taiwanensis TaxID=992267 RepID=A0A838XSZ5_9HYPH|nr:carbamoyltransferase C-terminal domain-containing protein [Stappia taiwanensis]MBA4613545.1 carbamoyltransferase [Stappia taiwanensis]GGE96630.1 carbamoyltransferase [Stappia taiwanensis]
MYILGLNAPPLGWHDPSAALIAPDGTVLALVEEERVSRRKHGLHQYPTGAIRACLDIAGIGVEDIATVAIGWDLPRQWPRRDRDALDPPLPGRLWSFDDWAAYLDACLGTSCRNRPDLVFVPHHTAHALSSFHGSGWPSAAVLIVDGNGDDEAISVYHAKRGAFPVRKARLPFSHSIGTMYDTVSNWIGLSFLEAGKTMGLAAYGRGTETAGAMFRIREDGIAPPFDLPRDSEYDAVVAEWNGHFERSGFRKSSRPVAELHTCADAVSLSWAAQSGLETLMGQLADWARALTGETRLCLAGGVALNCSANGLLPEPVYVPPVPHDAGVALGAAWFVAPPKAAAPLSPYLGRSASEAEIDRAIRASGLSRTPFDAARLATDLADGRIGALFTGRSEAGPRALCHRSILARPQSAEARDAVNRRKSRELWRPLSPVALASDCGAYWQDAPNLHRYMVGAATVSETCRQVAPGVVHVDGTARPQRVEDDGEPVARILRAMEGAGAPGLLINTSFNRRGEPIVDDPATAIDAFRAMRLDFLVFDDKWVVHDHG